MTYLVGILAALLSFGFIVFIHELGHFLAARWAGIHCPQFAIGFGPKLLAFNYRGTEFSLRIVPLGGYVLMDGEDPSMEGPESWYALFTEAVGDLAFPTTPAQVLAGMQESQRSEEQRVPEVEDFLRSLPPQRTYKTMGDLAGNFNHKSTWQKTVVILAGVTMNFTCAFLLLLGLGFTSGLGVVEDEILPRVGEVMPDGAAALAGLPKGVTIHALNGMPIVSGVDFTSQMRNKIGEKVRLSITEGGKKPRDIEIVTDLSLAERIALRQQGKDILLVRADPELIPKGARLPWKVEQVNGKAVTDLLQIKTWALAAKSLQLKGPQGQWTIESKDSGLNPRGVVGVVLASVTTFGFENKATRFVVGVTPGSQAETVGIQVGDEILDLQGVQVAGGQTQLDACLARISQRPFGPGDSLRFRVIRDGKLKELHVDETPASNTEAFGLKLQPVTPKLVVENSVQVMGMILRVPYLIVRGLMTNLVGTWTDLKKGSTGPIGIMQQIFEVSDEGLPELLFLVAILNAFIATFNLLPIPALDGSRCLFIWLGALRGRAFDPEKEARIHFFGIIVLLGIALLVSIQDVKRLIDGTPIMK